MRDGTIRTAFCLALGLAGVAVPVQAARADAGPKPGVAAQIAESQKLLTELQKPATSAEQKQEIVARLLELGDEGPRRLILKCEREYRAKHPAYLTSLERGATDALKARWKGKSDIEKEVADLRKTVLDVSRAEGLTKEMVKNQADPAMAKLDELMTVTADGVLEAIPALKAQRQELLDLAATWRRAAGRIPEDRRKSISAATAAPDPAALEEDLRAKEELAAMMATPMLKTDRSVLLANIPLAEKLDPAKARGMLILNLMRVRLGIGALAIDTKLCDASRGHSKDMREKKFFAHESPVPGKETPWARAKLLGTSAGAENIYTGSEKGEEAIKAWWYSPGHHKNMMGGHHRVALGRDGKLWTMMLG